MDIPKRWLRQHESKPRERFLSWKRYSGLAVLFLPALLLPFCHSLSLHSTSFALSSYLLIFFLQHIQYELHVGKERVCFVHSHIPAPRIATGCDGHRWKEGDRMSLPFQSADTEKGRGPSRNLKQSTKKKGKRKKDLQRKLRRFHLFLLCREFSE